MGKFLSQYEILFKKAKTDYIAADILFSRFTSGKTELDIEVVYFHLQQSAEKLIKAILSKNQVNYPKVHDLEILMNLIKEHHIDFKPAVDLLNELNDYAIEGRYSLIHDDMENMQKYFNLLYIMIRSTEKLLSL